MYQTTINKIRNGAKFSVNLKEHSLKVNGKWLVKNGVSNKPSGLNAMTTEETLAHLETLYEHYKHSVPTERSEKNNRQRYFYALPEHQLDDEDMLYGISRDVAQAELEIFVLLSFLDGNLKWDDTTMPGWFWQSKTDKDLILLRDWLVS